MSPIPTTNRAFVKDHLAFLPEHPAKRVYSTTIDANDDRELATVVPLS
jgi:hypothetical protein